MGSDRKRGYSHHALSHREGLLYVGLGRPDLFETVANLHEQRGSWPILINARVGICGGLCSTSLRADRIGSSLEAQVRKFATSLLHRVINESPAMAAKPMWGSARAQPCRGNVPTASATGS